jgi:hypothetical protein
MLENLVWTEVPPTDPPTLADGTEWDGRPQIFDINASGANIELFQSTIPDWKEKHNDYLTHFSMFITSQMMLKIYHVIMNIIITIIFIIKI